MAPELLIIDSFAGGGGASTGIERALGRSPNVAINHNRAALAMHAANHPETIHLDSNIWDVSPQTVCQGRRVGLLWASPDCKHFSKAKGGKPLDRNIRDLAWVVVRWAEEAQPDVIILENVEEFRTWGPVYEDGAIIPQLKGQTFDEWVKRLRRAGYKVEWRELRACDYGAPTIRRRLFVIARRDRKPIVWPRPTHGPADDVDVIAGRKRPWRTAADIIDFSLPCPSIFDTSAQIKEKYGLRAIRPLADNTLRRIARGVQRYVIDDRQPFFVTAAQHGGSVRSGFSPIHTITASPKDQNQVVIPTLIQTGYGEREGQSPRVLDLHKPLGTIVASGSKHALVAAFLAQHNNDSRRIGGVNPGRSAREPLSTLTARGTQQAVVVSHLLNMKGSERQAKDIRAPVPTICASATHAALVSAFMVKYYGTAVGQPLREPLHTVTVEDRQAVVTVTIDDTNYFIADIGMRMLTEREKFLAQGFGSDYVIDCQVDGRPLTTTEQGSCVGNSVAPDLAEALVAANCGHLARAREAAE
ncbi:DNA (cytosine-5)-methyltransferase 1 [Rhizobium subbaraonis]|uniref:DNA (cytosine-5-)-methyltransferase n=1 Tax=Rhizobium subbaraonis TaxID=908946 RepID=A0A285U541_9HYPH|nr:DNA cytosine methyltransferase [Rhizobium subbaraonis]SOC37060.1 DNA (cytosine-5)-methyltransferase 1 [Rhizobium subbaraonis]